MGEGNTNQATLTGPQKQLLAQLSSFVGPQIGQGIAAYQGPIAPGASALQNQGFNLAGSYSDPGRTGAIQAIMRGDPGYHVAGPEDYQRNFATAVEAPAMEQFRGDTLRSIAGKFGASGAGQSAALEAGRRLSVDLAGQKAQLGAHGLDVQQQAFGQASGQRGAGVQLGQADTSGAINAALTGGDIQRQIASQQNAEGLQKWTMSQPWANPYVTRFGQMALGTQASMGVPGHGKF